MRRAQEMHSRVAPAVPVSNARDNSRKESLPYVPETNHHRKASEDISSHSPDSKPSTMEKLFEDKEKLLILLLIMILSSEENSDPLLILALLYIII